MESIDRMREYAETKCGWGVSPEVARRIKEFTDAIEREVEQYVVAEIDAMPMTDENMAAAGWMRLPLDADGVAIHVGDVMEWPHGNGEFRVNGIGGNTLFYIDKDSGECEWTAAGDKRHHHAPTVEDVLREFTERLDEIGSEDDCAGVDEQECRACIRRDIAAAYAEYAAKLRLVGDE